MYYNIAVVEDAAMERDTLCALLQRYALDHKIDLKVDAFDHAAVFLKDYRPLKYSAVFLDIYMPDISGIDAARRIREVDQDTLLIFLTISQEHMPEAFECHAYDYIPKSMDVLRIYKVMDDITKMHIKRTLALSFTSGRNEVSLPYEDIKAVQSFDHYLYITDSREQTYITRMTFSSVWETLSADKRFLLINRGVLVNMDYIQRFDDGSCFLSPNLHFPINLRKSKMIEQLWQNYLFSKIRSESLERSGIV